LATDAQKRSAIEHSVKLIGREEVDPASSAALAISIIESPFATEGQKELAIKNSAELIGSEEVHPASRAKLAISAMGGCRGVEEKRLDIARSVGLIGAAGVQPRDSFELFETIIQSLSATPEQKELAIKNSVELIGSAEIDPRSRAALAISIIKSPLATPDQKRSASTFLLTTTGFSR